MAQGTLTVMPICGNFERDTETVGTMDPYCIVTVGSNNERTKVHPDGGKYPQWTDTFTFNVNGEEKVKFECKNRNHVASDDMIGSCEFALAQVYQAGVYNDFLQIFYNSMPFGTIRVQMNFTPAGGPPPPAAPYQAPMAPVAPAPAVHEEAKLDKKAQKKAAKAAEKAEKERLKAEKKAAKEAKKGEKKNKH